VNTQLLVHGIVQQTMVLIAQVATVGGVRAPLARVASQVFLDLTSELTAQGLGKHVIADMFGMALRTYHRKVRAVSESQTEQGRSVWEAVLEYIREQQPVTGRQVSERFRNDDAQVVTGVLNDLTHSGLTYRSGRAQDAVYRIADAADFSRQEGESRREGEEYLVWLAIFRQGPLTIEQVADALKLSEVDCKRAVDRLLGEGRVRALPAEQGAQGVQAARYASERFDVPVGAEGGYEAALLDHFQALVAAICVKLRAGAARSQPDDATGGGTYTFAVWPGHPLEDEARSLLPRVRALVNDLRERVDRHNTAIEQPAVQAPVVFYMGQYVQSDDGLGGS
jgi:DNA-binding Lrp family transcriptional regulator